MRYTHISFIGILIFLLGGYFFYTSYSEVGLFAGKIDTSVSGEQIHTESTIPKVCFRNPKVRFFMYHYIRDDDPRDTDTTRGLSIPPNIFDEQMNHVQKLAESGYITLMKGDDFMQALATGCYPGKDVWIFTDDDGWSDAYDNLAPIASGHHIPFFFGIIGNRIDEKGFVTSGEVRDIAQNPLFTISSHSMTHDDESHMSVEKEHMEMCESKKILENLIGKSIHTYIYPSGRMNSSGSIENLESCQYTLAWTTSFGKDFTIDNPHLSEINRIRIGRNTKLSDFDKLITPTNPQALYPHPQGQ